MSDLKLRLSLYGAFRCELSDGTRIAVTGARHRAILAMLATAAGGVHTRNWLQDILWGRSDPKNKQDSMRRAIADIRKVFGDRFDDFFEASSQDVRIRLAKIELLGDNSDGPFLEGISIVGQPGFDEWLHNQRTLGIGQHRSEGFLIAPSDLPTVAIIPFAGEGHGSHGRRVSDLIAHEVTRALSRSKLVNVISHLSSRRFAQQVLDLRRVRAALNIDYLVHGDLRVGRDRFDLHADFISVDTGHLVWTHEYSGSIEDLLSAQHSIVPDLANRIGFGILKSAVEIARTRPLSQVSNHGLLMAAIDFMHQQRLRAFSVSRRMLETLIEREGHHAIGHAWLGLWYLLFSAQGWSTNAGTTMSDARRNCAAALAVEPSNAFALTVDGMVKSEWRNDLTAAADSFSQAIQHDPNNALAWMMYARLKAFRGEGGEAVAFSDRAQRLSPLDPQRYLFDSLSGMCHAVNGNLPLAYEYITRSLAANPRHASTHRAKVITLQLMGNEQQARAAARKLLEIAPDFTVEKYLAGHPAAGSDTGQLWAQALGQSGIPIR